MSKDQNAERLISILEALSDITVTLVADFLTGPGNGGGTTVALGLANLGITVFPVGVVGEDSGGHEVTQALHEYRISTSGISKLKNYGTPADAGVELMHDEHPALLNLVEHARKFAAASEVMYVCDCGTGAASPRVLNFIKSNRCLAEKTLSARSRGRIADFEQLTTAIADENEIAQAIGIEIAGDLKKLTVAGQGMLKEMSLESFVAVSRERILTFSGTQKPSIRPIEKPVTAADVDVLGGITAAALAAGAAASDASQLAVQVVGFLGTRGNSGKRVRREELLASLSAPKPASQLR